MLKQLLAGVTGLAAAGVMALTMTGAASATVTTCHPSYTNYCLPPGSVDNKNCGDFPDYKNIRVQGTDTYKLDDDNDGLACEDPEKPTPPDRTVAPTTKAPTTAATTKAPATKKPVTKKPSPAASKTTAAAEVPTLPRTPVAGGHLPLIAGGAVVVVAGGTLLFLAARRRRTRFEA